MSVWQNVAAFTIFRWNVAQCRQRFAIVCPFFEMFARILKVEAVQKERKSYIT